jgi:hypothetical protein
MSRIRIFSQKGNEDNGPQGKLSPNFQTTNEIGPNQTPKRDSFLIKIVVDYPLKRKKAISSGKKKRLLVKLYQEKVQEKSERILKLRKAKLDQFKINYIPLCADEDWEMIAAFYAKNSGKQ